MTILGDYYENGIPNGWSPLGGQVKSPFGVDLDTSGSSAGSAVALAAGMAAATLGAETMGSIVSRKRDVEADSIADGSRPQRRSMGYETYTWISQQ